jgi:hypothetical protein
MRDRDELRRAESDLSGGQRVRFETQRVWSEDSSEYWTVGS